MKTYDQKDDSTSGKPSSHVGEDRTKDILNESPSLKRKRTRDDEHENSSPYQAEYPHNLELIYPPKKRSRTPSSEGTSQEVLPETLPVSKQTDAHQYPVDVSPVIDCLQVLPETLPVQTANDAHRDPVNNPAGSSAEDSSAPTPPAITPEQPPRSSNSQHNVTLNAFSAFSGTSSPFSTASPRPSKLKPAWSESSLGKNLNEGSECITEEGSSLHVLVAATGSNSTEVEHHTGEENEDIKQDLKGVKFFVKRGDKPFSDGILGHIKLLSDKTTLDERLLFRREPLWQVSLNIRLHPSIRCTFDANEHVLRILVTEPVESKDEREIVIYAFKPGRSCSKQDFKEFSEAFLESPGLQEKNES
ncbi:hypothetical protein C0992_005545 [Termitomyces sp. T32_za158]|nr:hypothetical protein C0992_005545 [Termitomyces sp. T32_za158]